jgi:hypothetical protein
VRAPLSAATPDSKPAGVEPDEDGNFIGEGYYLPKTVTLPLEVHAGIAFQAFRPLNLRWVNPRDEGDSAAARLAGELRAEREVRATRAARLRAEAGADPAARDRLEDAREREEEEAERRDGQRMKEAKRLDRRRRLAPYKTMPREKLLVSAGVKITAMTKDGVGLESFLRQRVERSGETPSFSPRLGVESEVIPAYLVLRAGSYYEPTRFRTGAPRVHGTGGLDVRIPIAWSVFGLLDDDTTFRVSGAIDAARSYFGWSVGAGLWH